MQSQTESRNSSNSEITKAPSSRDGVELFLISLLILFLELANIRWFPAHVLYLTFFTNVVLLACFLGMSVGCLAARQRRRYLPWTPLLLIIALVAGTAVEISSGSFLKLADTSHDASSQNIYFGTAAHTQDLSRYAVPVEVLCGFFFLVIALALIGPGQELGRALNRQPNRVKAYTVNIAGSIAGIVLFALLAWLEWSPTWWFLLIALGLGYFYFVSPHRQYQSIKSWAPITTALLVGLVAVASYSPVHNDYPGQSEARQIWSPYYRIDFKKQDLSLSVNLIYHQQMVSRNEVFPAYALPHLLNRDSGRQPFKDVLIIGAGSGNDVSRALQWGATHVDAVEIDPAIYRLGRENHPDQPYQDSRVDIHLDDGRNFLRSSTRKYDLVIYALVDSLVLHSGYSNIRLESYLFTKQTFADVRDHLKPDGTFVIYNYFRQGWLATRLLQGLEETFGNGNPLVLTLPYRQSIEPEMATFGDFTIFFAGHTDELRNAFNRRPEYFLRDDQTPSPATPNGFELNPSADPAQHAHWQKFGPATVSILPGGIRSATDDWPFLYLREPMIPSLSFRGMFVMAGIALVLILLFQPRGKSVTTTGVEERGRHLQFFFLGSGFMLIETKAVVSMALLFGSTWLVNSVVFFAVLLMILISNLWTLRTQPRKLWPYYTGLLIALLLNVAIPLDLFLGMGRLVQVFLACLLVFAPVFFAGVIFAASFKRAVTPDRAFGFNIAGAMMGGLAEYCSMLLGFRYLILLAILFYTLSAVGLRARKGKVVENFAVTT
jgi:spermidine synthase